MTIGIVVSFVDVSAFGGVNRLIEKRLIEEAKEKLGDSTADIIADILQIEKYDSKNKKGCCPFHSENTVLVLAISPLI